MVSARTLMVSAGFAVGSAVFSRSISRAARCLTATRGLALAGEGRPSRRCERTEQGEVPVIAGPAARKAPFTYVRGQPLSALTVA